MHTSHHITCSVYLLQTGSHLDNAFWLSAPWTYSNKAAWTKVTRPTDCSLQKKQHLCIACTPLLPTSSSHDDTPQTVSVKPKSGTVLTSTQSFIYQWFKMFFFYPYITVFIFNKQFWSESRNTESFGQKTSIQKVYLFSDQNLSNPSMLLFAFEVLSIYRLRQLTLFFSYNPFLQVDTYWKKSG